MSVGSNSVEFSAVILDQSIDAAKAWRNIQGLLSANRISGCILQKANGGMRIIVNEKSMTAANLQRILGAGVLISEQPTPQEEKELLDLPEDPSLNPGSESSVA